MSDIFRSCPFCGKELQATLLDNGTHIAADCDVCGNYIFKFNNSNTELNDKIASYLFYHKDDIKRPCFFIGERSFYESKYKDEPRVKYVSIDEIENWYPKTFSEKIDRIILEYARRSKSYGYLVRMSLESFASLCFVKRYIGEKFHYDDSFFDDQMNYINETLTDTGLLDGIFAGAQVIDTRFQLTPSGWERVDELQKNEKNNKNVFVSMAFNDNTKLTREAIRQGIIDSGLSPEFIDEIIHNHQIMPEMFRLIRESKMLILEISDPNFGAYYEAGYALGLGKEVIICCNQDVFNGKININNEEVTKDEMKKFEKYLKPHFDIAQKQILVWKDHKDLTNKLAEWIKAIV